jgi:HK97 family phage major capsid protein
MSKLKELREKRAKVHAESVVILNKAEMTAEDRAAYDKMATEIETISGDIDRIVRAEKMEAELRGVSTEPIVVPGVDADPKKAADAYRKAFANYLTRGFAGSRTQVKGGLSADETRLIMETKNRLTDPNKSQEQRDQEAGTQSISYTQGTLGGFFVPAGFVYDIEVATKYFAPLLDGSSVKVFETATGQVLPYPTSNDTNQAWTIVGEASQVSDNGTNSNYASQANAPSANPGNVLAGHINFGAFKGTTGLIRVSLELLQDSAFSIESFLSNAFAVRLGRGYEFYLTQGTGVNQPTGIIPAISASGAVPITALGSASNDGSAATGANSIGWADLVNLEHSVDPTYRRNAKYMFHDDTLRFLRTLLDKFGRPLWVPAIKDGDVDTINGYPYVINQAFSKIAASATTVAFGAFEKFLVRKVRDLQVLRLDERFADFGEVAYVAFSRLDSNLLDAGTHPLNVLIQHS